MLPSALAFALAIAPAAASPAWQEAGLRRFAYRRWTIEQGLPQNTITDLLQTDDGYLWLTTFGGLARFDGDRFEVYDLATAPGLTTNRFLSVFEGSDGVLWLGTEENGAFRFQDGRFTAVSEEIDDQSVWDIAQDGSGGVWLATDIGLYRSPSGGSALRRYSVDEGLPSPRATSLLFDAAGRLWVGTQQGLAVREGDRFVAVDTTWHIRTLQQDPEGRLWAGANSGVLRLGEGGLELVSAHDQWVSTMAWDASDNLWISSDQGPGILGEGGLEPLPTDGPPILVRAFFADSEGNLWIGTNGQGLLQVQQQPFSRHSLPEAAASQDIGSILEDSSGALWLGSACGGLARVAGGAVEVVDPDVCVRSLAEEPGGGALWYTADRLLVRRSGEQRETFGESDGLPDSQLRGILFDREGRLWVAATRGIFRRDAPGQRFAPVPGLEGALAESLTQAPDGRIWIGQTQGVIRLDGGRPTRLGAADGIPPGQVRAIHVDQGGVAWIGTYGGGLARLTPAGERYQAARLTTAHGLFDDAISRIIDDGRGNLWFNSDRGVFRVRRDELDRAADGLASSVQGFSYRTGEGSGGSPGGWLARSGRLWFPTIAGAVEVDPAAGVGGPGAITMVIEQALLGGQALSGGEDLQIERRDLVVRYTAPHFSDPANVRFRYKLEGYDAAWIEAGPARSASYTNLPPGAYAFLVEAGDIAGAWQARNSLEFTIQPSFYETRGFAVLFIGVVIAGSIGLYRRRTSGIRQRNLTLQREIRARHQVEVILRERQDHYRTIFEQATNGFLLHAPDGLLEEINRTGCRMLGLSRPAISTLPPLEFVAPASREAYRDLIRRVCEGENVQDEGLLLLRGGEAFAIRLLGVPYSRRGQANALFSVVDISEERRIEAEKEALAAQLQQAQKLEAVGQLAGGIAHDFNNLLTVMLAYAGMLEDTLEGEPAEYIREIRASGEKGATLTRKLLAFSRRQVLKPITLDLPRFLAELERLLRAALRADIALSLDLHDPLPPVYVDPAQLEQSLLNLAFNASDAMPDGGRLVIGARPEMVAEARGDAQPGLYTVLSVQDSGAGMDATVLAHIFEPFFTTKPLGKGTGLGLSSVHGFLKQSGGYIAVESAPGQGSTFRLYLPAVATATWGAAQHPPPAAARPEDAFPPKSASILLCDDEDGVRRSTVRLLRRHGHHVLVAESPEQALEIATTQPFDLLLTDVVMPGMKGTELAARIRASYPEARVLFMSGYNREAGLVGEAFLEKPFTADALLAQIQRMLSAEA